VFNEARDFFHPGGEKVELTCHHVREHLSAWLDGEAAPEVHAAVAAHLETCDSCRQELAQLAALDQALGSLTAPVPPMLGERVLARLPQQRRRPWWQSMALAASLLLGIVLGGTMARDFYPYKAANGNGQEIMALEDFHDFPQGSLGTILASYQLEESNGT
jgi:predicted anti-sigma-YlaC factor YlaD